MSKLKQFVSGVGGPLLLPERTFSDASLKEETASARKLLNVSVRPGQDGVAIVKSFSGIGGGNSIACHFASSFVDDYALDLSRIFAHTPEATIMVRAIRNSPAAFVRHIREESAKEKSDVRREFLSDVQDWAFPRQIQQVCGHDLLISAPTETVFQQNREETAGLFGRVVNYLQYGPMARSVIYGLPLDMSESKRDPITGAFDPVWWAAPRKVIWGPRFHALPSENIAFGYWSGVVNPKNIEELLGMGDLLIHAVHLEKYLYFNVIVRVAVPFNNAKPDFSSYAAQFSKLGKWEQRSGKDIRECFLAYIPGTTKFPSWFRHSVEKPLEVLGHLSKTLNAVGDRNGTNMIGLMQNDQPLLLDPWLRPGRVYDGPSKSGKSTIAAAHALGITNNIVWLPLTAAEYEGAPHWVKRTGGTVVKLNLPDAYSMTREGGTKRQREVIVERQKELHALDKEDAEKRVSEFEDEWCKKGKITGLPLTFQVESGESVRLLNWYTHFLYAWRDAWRRWYENTGERCLVIADNFSALRLTDDDPLLKEIPGATGKNLGLSLTWFVSNGRNVGVACWLLTHSVIEDLDLISPGLFKQMGLRIGLNHNDYTTAVVELPKDREIMATVTVRLPNGIRTLVERQEPGVGGNNWKTTEVASVPS